MWLGIEAFFESNSRPNKELQRKTTFQKRQNYHGSLTAALQPVESCGSTQLHILFSFVL